jgi:crossover junction endodeoxyribonuclease RuvC
VLSLGLDISSTSTGAVVLNGMGGVIWQGLWKPPAGLDYIQRGSYQAEQMLKVLDEFPPQIVCIEGYSLGSTHNAEPLITVGTILRYFLRQCGYDWTVVAPTQLKKYAGAQLKQDIKLAVWKRWQFEHRSDDVVDA